MNLAEHAVALPARLRADPPSLRPVLAETLWRFHSPRGHAAPGICAQALDVVNAVLDDDSHPWRRDPGIEVAIAAALYQIRDRQGLRAFHLYTLVIATRVDADTIAWWRALLAKEELHD